MNLIKTNKIINLASTQRNSMICQISCIPLALIIATLSGCAFFQNKLPQIKVDFATSQVSVMDSEYFIDSIAMIDSKSEYPLFALKSFDNLSVNPENSVLLKSPGSHYKSYGTFDSACIKKNLRVLMFIKNLKVKDRDWYSSIYYHCNVDSVVITKVEGGI